MNGIIYMIMTMILYSCSASIEEDSSEISSSEIEHDLDEFECDVIDQYGNPDCRAYMSFIDGAYQDQDYRDAIYQCESAIRCGCSTSRDDDNILFASQIYSYLAKTYAELDEHDSVSYAIDKGLSYLPEDIDLLNLGIWNARITKTSESEILYLELKREIDNSITTFEELSEAYRKNEDYNNQISILQEWLDFQPDNERAIAELKLAFQKVGKDEFELDKKRCEENPNNLEYCLNYAKVLIEKGRNEEGLKVLYKIKKKHKKNEMIFKMIAETNQYENNVESLIHYKELVKMKPDNIIYLIEISRIYQDDEVYSIAIKWAKRAINKTNGESELALFNLAEVYRNSVESCSESEYTIEDKMVNELSYKYYAKSYGKGYSDARVWVDYFKKNQEKILPTFKDWFLILDNSTKTEYKPSEIKNYNNCYSWVEEYVKVKSK